MRQAAAGQLQPAPYTPGRETADRWVQAERERRQAAEAKANPGVVITGLAARMLGMAAAEIDKLEHRRTYDPARHHAVLRNLKAAQQLLGTRPASTRPPTSENTETTDNTPPRRNLLDVLTTTGHQPGSVGRAATDGVSDHSQT